MKELIDDNLIENFLCAIIIGRATLEMHDVIIDEYM